MSQTYGRSVPRSLRAALHHRDSVVHGHQDPFFPVGNGEALAREIPGARLSRNRQPMDLNKSP